MIINNLLNFKFVNFFDGGLANVPLSGATQLVAKIINALSFGGSIAVGILLFSLLLKIIPLPLDIFSRASSKKSALKMEKMRPELEKLQKQFAHNNTLYQQKVMALYKKEGYSQFAACLPTIITLVFFIIVINAFTQFSTYSKIDTFNKMAVAYSDNIRYSNENVKNITYYEIIKEDGKKLNLVLKDDLTFDYSGDVLVIENETYNITTEKLVNIPQINVNTAVKKVYFYDESIDYNEYIVKPAQDAAADVYFEEAGKMKFLWVKNIWIEDLPWKKAFISKEDYLDKTFTYTKGCSAKNIDSEIKNGEIYDILMGSSKLDDVKKKPNGFLILVVLSIGTMLISQLVMTKSQKAQMELQSVDGANGQAAQTSKMMMWMMPIMFGFFAFVYTASFSLYLIVSTTVSTISTVIINFFVEKAFQKKLKIEEEEKYQKRYGHLNKKDSK